MNKEKTTTGNSGLQKLFSLIITHEREVDKMDDIAESLISRFISQLKVRLVEVFEVLNIEVALPLILNSKQCKKIIGNSERNGISEGITPTIPTRCSSGMDA